MTTRNVSYVLECRFLSVTILEQQVRICTSWRTYMYNINKICIRITDHSIKFSYLKPTKKSAYLVLYCLPRGKNQTGSFLFYLKFNVNAHKRKTSHSCWEDNSQWLRAVVELRNRNKIIQCIQFHVIEHTCMNLCCEVLFFIQHTSSY